jgi:hypothetical protein
LGRCTLWSKTQKEFLCLSVADDFSRATKGITNSTIILKATIVSKVTVTI